MSPLLRTGCLAAAAGVAAGLMVAAAGAGAWWLWSRQAGVPRTGASPGAARPDAAPSPAPTPEPTPVERAEGTLGPAGGAVALPSGGRYEVAPAAADRETPVRLLVTDPPPLPSAARLLGRVHTLVSDTRARVLGDSRLELPVPATLPAGLREADLQAYALYDGRLLHPVPGRYDAARRVMVVPHPRVTTEMVDGEAARALSAQPQEPAPSAAPPPPPVRPARTGYVVGDRTLIPGCRTGLPGDVYEEPRGTFSIHFEVRSTCALASRIASVLQAAKDLYDVEYADAGGRRAFAHLTPERRMHVYLGNYGRVNGEYKFFTSDGYLVVDAGAAQANLAVLEQVLYHEMFHAVQDVYTNMFWAGTPLRISSPMWWYEATAEWAGFRYTRTDVATAVRTELQNYPYLLSVPPISSRSYEAGLLSYGYALLVDHVERRKPDYVYRVLMSGRLQLNEYMNSMVREGDLTATYPDFVREVMTHALPRPGIWTTARIVEADAETRVYAVDGTTPGVGEAAPRRLREDAERGSPQAIHLVVPSMTTRFVQVSHTGLREPRRVVVGLQTELLEYRPAEPGDQAWLLRRRAGANLDFVRLPRGGTTVPGFGRDFDELWIAVFNADAYRLMIHDLSVQLVRGRAPMDVGGAWQDRYGACITFTQTGEQASGVVSYPDGSTGRLAGTVDGGTYTFTFEVGADRGRGTMSGTGDRPSSLAVSFAVEGKGTSSVTFERLPGACPARQPPRGGDCYRMCRERCRTLGSGNFGQVCNSDTCCHDACAELQGLRHPTSESWLSLGYCYEQAKARKK